MNDRGTATVETVPDAERMRRREEILFSLETARVRRRRQRVSGWAALSLDRAPQRRVLSAQRTG